MFHIYSHIFDRIYAHIWTPRYAHIFVVSDVNLRYDYLNQYMQTIHIK